MYLLDSDTTTLAFRNNRLVVARLSQTLALSTEVYISTVSVEEMMQGTLASINTGRTKSAPSVTVPSQYLVDLLINLAAFQILTYTDEAERLFRSFPAAVRRVGGMDCRIAAHAIISGLVVVTRNTRDFSRIPGVETEDWSV